ncbi:MAG: helix-turn-helix transcriptional regulator [Candidatus Peribacteria bacterium]|nr:helix-turn-helix transcriptional regulator [Candidatus Peribacteria bacterium]
MTQSIVSELEAGEYNPSIEVLTKIADALEISIEYFTKENFNRRFLETLDYFISHLPTVDILKLMKLVYFADIQYYQKN